MSRIRSIHPGIWTDENFAMLSHAARVLLFGIWTEADDHGVFEWKPVALKMKIFPADKVDMEPLLDELTTFKCVKKFTHDARDYGAVRNFMRFQRPKKPNYRYVLPQQARTYVGLKEESTEPVPNQFPTGGEKSPQMEREDGRGGGGRTEFLPQNSIEEDTAIAVTPTTIVFESGVIRLNQRDFQKWEKAYSYLDLRAELIGLTEWANEQDDRWFFAVAGALTKRNREVKSANNRPKRNGIDELVERGDAW